MPDSPTSLDRISSGWSGPTDAIDDEKIYEVQLEPEDDPQRLSLLRRWLAVVTISSCAHFVTFASSVVRSRHRSLRARSTLMFPLLGSVLLGWRVGELSCRTRSRHLEHELVCRRAGHRPSFCRSNIRDIWA